MDWICGCRAYRRFIYQCNWIAGSKGVSGADKFDLNSVFLKKIKEHWCQHVMMIYF
jgi:hypothetical protein